MDDKLTVKTAKFTSLENLYVYGSYRKFLRTKFHTPALNISSLKYFITVHSYTVIASRS